MSAASIQRKLNKAYGKVARMTGYVSDVYRISQRPDYPIHPTNWMHSANASYSQDPRFSAPVGSNKWLTWIDPTLDQKFDLKVGDMLVDSFTEIVYYIIDMHPLHPIRSLECNTFIDVSATNGYGDSGDGWGISTAKQIATHVPAWVQVSGSTSIDGGFVPARTALGQFSDVYTVELWMPEGTINTNDVITLKSGLQLTVNSAQWDIRGYKITASKVA